MEKNWRIIGQYRNSQTFLVVVGHTPDECISLLRQHFADWTYDEILDVRAIWTEKWVGVWEPVEDIEMKRYRIIAKYQIAR